MANLNKVFLIGNLTRDPEVRYIPSGRAVADINLAVNRKYKTNTGEDREDTCFVGVVAWGRQAEIVGEYLKKGSAVFIEGSLRFEQWETNGEKRSRLRVVASRIQFLDRLKREPDNAPEKTSENRSESTPAASENRSESTPAASVDGPDIPEDVKSDPDDLPF